MVASFCLGGGWDSNFGTACGRATVMALRLNNPISVNVRKAWVSVG